MNECRLSRLLRPLALGSLALGSLSCGGSARTAPAPAPASGGYAYPNQAPQPAARAGAPTPWEAYQSPQALRQIGSALLFLPGSARQQQVNFATVNGQAVLDGDILLGPATALPFRYGLPRQAADQKGAVALADRSYLWPNGEIPYLIDASARDKVDAITWATHVYDSTPLKIRPRIASDRDYVVFRELGDGCWSYLGRQGGPQDIDVTTCAGGNVAHELMHAAGFYHEQSRGDRDQYITIMWDEISPEMRSNFDKRDARGQDIGPYDYASIMHYPSQAGSKSGNPTIVPRVPNVQIGQRDGLSALDRAAIDTLYRGRSSSTGAALPATPAAPALTLPSLPVPTPQPPAPVVPARTASIPPAPNPTPAPSNSGSFGGTYGSARGNVSCTQGGVFAQCQYPGGNLFCAANGPELACTWSGGGQGRAAFVRQASGVLSGTWGDGLSVSSRGQWDLVPLAASAAPATTMPAPAAAAPVSATASLSGNFSSTRGAMACVEGGASLSCNFQEADGVGGRLDCTKSQNGHELSCAWITFLPRPATGRATFTRASVSERRLTGTWGLFLAATGGGAWDVKGQ